MEKRKEYLEVDRGVAEGTKTLDELAEQVGAHKRPARPVGVDRPETNPDHGPVREMPQTATEEGALDDILRELEQK